MADDWQTVPARQPRHASRGRGGNRKEPGRDGQQHRSQSRSRAGQSEGRGWRAAGKQSQPQQAQQAQQGWRTGSKSRSRSRGPRQAAATTAADADGVAFKLETSNMFALHVGKGSRARKDEGLQGFFEARDDEEEDEAFDAIDDSDLDVSGYESEDDRDEATEFPPVPVRVHCSFCCGAEHDRALFTDAAELAAHLREEHRMVFKNLSHMVLLLQKYLDAWAQKLSETSMAEVARPLDESEPPVYHIDAAQCSADKDIRSRVQKEGLVEVLAAQEAERQGPARAPRKCLFCKRVCEDRRDLFRHGYREHSFNIGLPDNLVWVDDFLAILESKLASQQCLYCEKTFTSAAVLRKHMRKKKHFKISSHNRLYDRFYVVNYLEPGKSWEAIENENADESDSDDRKDDSWEDWDDRAEEMPAKSLFDDRVLSSAAECWDYMVREFGFDIHRIRRDHGLDFYKTIALINAIRRCSAGNKCFACCQQFADSAALAAHSREEGAAHLVPPSDTSMWEDKANLRPAIDNDPLLIGFDDDDDDADAGDEESSRKRLEESKRILRNRLSQISLDARPDDTVAKEAVTPHTAL
ncbi:hypothetical protein H4R20_004215 [Coemansia guatemalensis]|uniref:C2H2-type domain-containing protein n=1 Tax=Coemansia guatemalensis TaxID=2761395 RepID=A0A9W8HS53_9FUNG|nr:hypothetical protein H4R20_004215 [Coemansia guatemalensis]